jgi:hypothetical protein
MPSTSARRKKHDATHHPALQYPCAAQRSAAASYVQLHVLLRAEGLTRCTMPHYKTSRKRGKGKRAAKAGLRITLTTIHEAGEGEPSPAPAPSPVLNLKGHASNPITRDMLDGLAAGLRDRAAVLEPAKMKASTDAWVMRGTAAGENRAEDAQIFGDEINVLQSIAALFDMSTKPKHNPE